MNESIIDIEEYAKKGIKPPVASQYRIRVDGDRLVTKSRRMTGAEILALAGRTPVERYMLNVQYAGGQVSTIGYEDTVDLTTQSLERFRTLPLDQREGTTFRIQYLLEGQLPVTGNSERVTT